MKRKSYIRRTSKRPRRQLEMVLDKLWQQDVQQRADNKCEMCGGKWKLSGHHSIKRDHKWHRHQPTNGTCLCGEHHSWAETHPVEFAEWLAVHAPERHEYYMLYKNERSRGPVPLSLMQTWKEQFAGGTTGSTEELPPLPTPSTLGETTGGSADDNV